MEGGRSKGGGWRVDGPRAGRKGKGAINDRAITSIGPTLYTACRCSILSTRKDFWRTK